jgi:hypothetical protein
MRAESSPPAIRRTGVPDRQASLRRDISELSAVLGRTLVRQEGADLLDLFERVRHLIGTDRKAAADLLTALGTVSATRTAIRQKLLNNWVRGRPTASLGLGFLGSGTLYPRGAV